MSWLPTNFSKADMGHFHKNFLKSLVSEKSSKFALSCRMLMTVLRDGCGVVAAGECCAAFVIWPARQHHPPIPFQGINISQL